MTWLYLLGGANLLYLFWVSLKTEWIGRRLEYLIEEQDKTIRALADSMLDGNTEALKHLRGARRVAEGIK